MFSLLESKEEIENSQHKLEVTLQREFPHSDVRDIGYPSGRQTDAQICVYEESYWFWSGDYRGKGIPRRQNWFGLIRPGVLGITVEINVPYQSQSKNLAGYFARDSVSKSIYLMHSGKIGGGAKGVGKNAFLASSSPQLIEVIDATGGIRLGVIVMPIEGYAASRSAISYIDTIALFRQEVRNREFENSEPIFERNKQKLKDFYAEARGRRKGKRPGEIDYISRHGDVVEALRKWREKKGIKETSRLVKDVYIDMGVANNRNRLLEIYEVKTKATTQDVYCAIGQLLVHGNSKECEKVLVLPITEKISPKFKETLKRLNIDILWFKLNKVSATILELKFS